jgi:glycosyltransferase involved in cell wall biosynthesis
MTAKNPIRVAFFLPPLKGVAGVARYCRELINALSTRDDTRTEIVVFGNRADPLFCEVAAMPGILAVETWLASKRTSLRIVFEHLCLWWVLRKHAITLYHGLNNVIPLICPFPSVVTVHDMSFVTMPGVHTFTKRWYWRDAVSRSIHRSRRVIAVSGATASDIERLVPDSAGKLDIVCHGVSGRSPTIGDGGNAVGNFLGDSSFILFVGTIEPRKNLPRLLTAFGLVIARGSRDLKLIIVGKMGWHAGEFISALAVPALKGRVAVSGFLEDDAVSWLYSHAKAFVYPSLMEGFGMPILEAMALGTPVVTSKGSATEEVSGGAAILVDPLDPESIACGIEKIIGDPDLGNRMRSAGIKRSKEFTWTRAAAETMCVYGKAIDLNS